MYNTPDTLLLFGFLTFLNLWGGAAAGAGLRARVALPVLWGLLVGVGPMYFGLERGIKLDSWAALAWQLGCFLASVIAAAAGPARLRAWLLHAGMTAVMIGSLLMAAGAGLGALLYWRGFEALSLILGGASFIFGAMWFGSGLYRLRGRS
jgi:hypothetical protein